MTNQMQTPHVLAAGHAKVPLEEYHLSLAGREWTVLHTGLLLTAAGESRFFDGLLKALPYGVALWPSSIALAYEVAARADSLEAKTILELGAGTGLPGIVAASFGAIVTQTDSQEIAMNVCASNGQVNGVPSIEYRLVDWTDWRDDRQYDYIIGSDILYADSLHEPLRHIFETNLAVGGRLLLADRLRKPSLSMFDALEVTGWDIDVTQWELGDGDDQRKIAIFDISRLADK